MSSSISSIKGSCACGKVGFIAAPNPRTTIYCYCTTCRKCSGAPYLPFAHFHKDDVKWDGEPDQWKKSDVAIRGHCSTCGSTISMAYNSEPSEIAIAVGCIDEGVELIKPVSRCIFVKEKPDWAELPKDVPAQDDM